MIFLRFYFRCDGDVSFFVVYWVGAFLFFGVIGDLVFFNSRYLVVGMCFCFEGVELDLVGVFRVVF